MTITTIMTIMTIMTVTIIMMTIIMTIMTVTASLAQRNSGGFEFGYRYGFCGFWAIWLVGGTLVTIRRIWVGRMAPMWTKLLAVGVENRRTSGMFDCSAVAFQFIEGHPV